MSEWCAALVKPCELFNKHQRSTHDIVHAYAKPGVVVFANVGWEQRFAVEAKALERGVILGRYERCVGGGEVEFESVSRVHAALMSVDGVVHLIDAGSTHGEKARDEDVKCIPAQRGTTYTLGTMPMRWELVQ